MTEEYILLIIIVLVASLLQASTGYGFSIVGTPFLLVIFPAHVAIQINIILSIFLSASMIYSIRSEWDKILLLRLIKGCIPGLFLGIFIYLYMNVSLLKTTIGIFIIFVTLLLILKFTVRRTSGRDFRIGAISGFLTTSIGVPGPPLLLYFSGSRMDKITLRSTTLAYYLFVYTVSLVMQMVFGGTNAATWLFSLSALPALFAGIILGQLAFKWMNQRTFQIITYIILLFTGIYLFISGVM